MSAEPGSSRRYYVYALKNGAGEVFYVGRGSGGRMLTHLADSHSHSVNRRLAEAVASDELVTAEVLSWHATEADSVSEERRVIKSYPAGALVNIVHAEKPKLTAKDIKRLKYEPGLGEIAALAAEARYWKEQLEITTAQRDEEIRRRANSMTLAALAEQAGISVGRVSHIVGYRGVKVGRPRKNIPPPS